MLNKRKKIIHKITPIKIDNYNKFLLTLDNTNDNKKENKHDFNINAIINNYETNNNKDKTDNAFDKILNNFNNIDQNHLKAIRSHQKNT